MNNIRPAIGLTAVLALSPAAGLAVSLQDLFDGDNVNIPGVMIDEWTLESDVSSVGIDWNQIDVTAMHLPKGSFGIWYDFDDQLVVDNDDFIDFQFSYRIWSSIPIGENWVYLSDPVFGDPDGGLIQVYEDVFTEGGVLLASKLAEIDAQFDIYQPADYASWWPKQQHLYVEKRIVLQSDGALVKLGDLHQHMPEPGSLTLLAFGLAGLAAGARRRRAS